MASTKIDKIGWFLERQRERGCLGFQASVNKKLTVNEENVSQRLTDEEEKMTDKYVSI